MEVEQICLDHQDKSLARLASGVPVQVRSAQPPGKAVSCSASGGRLIRPPLMQRIARAMPQSWPKHREACRLMQQNPIAVANPSPCYVWLHRPAYRPQLPARPPMAERAARIRCCPASRSTASAPPCAGAPAKAHSHNQGNSLPNHFVLAYIPCTFGPLPHTDGPFEGSSDPGVKT